MFLDAGPVVLRPLQEGDREPLIAVLMDADVMKYALDERPFTHAKAEAFVGSNFAVGDDALGMHSISLKATTEPIGFAGYRRCLYLGAGDTEFGWILAKPHHGRGYATALGKALIRYALDNLNLDRILAACNPANAPSEHILRDKLQMRFEREVEARPSVRRRVYVAAPSGGVRWLGGAGGRQ